MPEDVRHCEVLIDLKRLVEQQSLPSPETGARVRSAEVQVEERCSCTEQYFDHTIHDHACTPLRGRARPHLQDQHVTHVRRCDQHSRSKVLNLADLLGVHQRKVDLTEGPSRSSHNWSGRISTDLEDSCSQVDMEVAEGEVRCMTALSCHTPELQEDMRKTCFGCCCREES